MKTLKVYKAKGGLFCGAMFEDGEEISRVAGCESPLDVECAVSEHGFEPDETVWQAGLYEAPDPDHAELKVRRMAKVGRKKIYETPEARRAAQREAARKYREKRKIESALPGVEGPQALLAAILEHEKQRKALIKRLELELDRLRSEDASEVVSRLKGKHAPGVVK